MRFLSLKSGLAVYKIQPWSKNVSIQIWRNQHLDWSNAITGNYCYSEAVAKGVLVPFAQPKLDVVSRKSTGALIDKR